MTKRVEELTRQLFNKWMREQELADRETTKEQMKKDKEEFTRRQEEQSRK
jgi:hypothetical protein